VLWGDTAAGASREVDVVPVGSSSLSFDHCLVRGDPFASVFFVRTPDPGADGTWGTDDDDYGDLHLRSDSSGIDDGDNFYVPGGITTDVAGDPRFVDAEGGGAIVDIGAYEYQLPLAAVMGRYQYNAANPTISITFNGDINPATLAATDLMLLDPATGQPLPNLPAPAVTYDSVTRTANWVFSTPLPDGNYRAKLAAGSVSDARGNLLGDDFTFDFFVLAGDANHDAVVDTADLNVLAVYWNGSNKTFAQGDFNYDGHVDVADLVIFSGNWQKTPSGEIVSDAPMPSLVPAPQPTSSSARRTRAMTVA
jgi:hypothetical protein